MKLSLKKILYNTGDFLLPKVIKKNLDKIIYSKNIFCLNGWSIIHFLAGIFIGYTLLLHNNECYLYKLLLIHTFWELWQIFIGMSKPFILIENGKIVIERNIKIKCKNNIIDFIVDTILFLLGGFVTYKIL
jgi:hypothetical protein